MEATPKIRTKRKQELSLLDEFLESDDHFQGGKYDKPIHMRDKEAVETPPRADIDRREQVKDVVQNPQLSTPLNGVNLAASPISNINDPGLKIEYFSSTSTTQQKTESKYEQTSSKLVANDKQTISKVLANYEQSISNGANTKVAVETASNVNEKEQTNSKVVANHEQSGSSEIAPKADAEKTLNTYEIEQTDSKVVANH